LIQIKIEIKKRNRFKELFYNVCNKTEDFLFIMIQKLPMRFTPKFLMEWLQQYINKRIANLNRQIVHDRWQSMELEKAVNTIRQHDINKAPSED